MSIPFIGYSEMHFLFFFFFFTIFIRVVTLRFKVVKEFQIRMSKFKKKNKKPLVLSIWAKAGSFQLVFSFVTVPPSPSIQKLTFLAS